MDSFSKIIEEIGISLLKLPITRRRMGIYFLFENEALQYIGQSVNVYSRIAEHARYNAISFNNVLFFDVKNRDCLDEIERCMISYFKPPCNCDRSKKYSVDVESIKKCIVRSVDKEFKDAEDDLNEFIYNNTETISKKYYEKLKTTFMQKIKNDSDDYIKKYEKDIDNKKEILKKLNTEKRKLDKENKRLKCDIENIKYKRKEIQENISNMELKRNESIKNSVISIDSRRDGSYFRVMKTIRSEIEPIVA